MTAFIRGIVGVEPRPHNQSQACVFPSETGRRFVLALVILFLPFAALAADDLTVTVSGTGASIDEARTDAVRQALQQAISQLVIVDRVVSNDRLVRDNVMSTMNGYVERFRQLKLDRTSEGFSLDAEVTVSASRIANFVGVTTGGGTALEGMGLLAESAREIAQRKARGEILDRLFRGFPAETSDIRIAAITPSTTDPNSLVISFSYTYKPQFVAALVDTLHALAIHPCQKIELNDRRFTGMTLQQLANASTDDRWCLQQFATPVTAAHDVACLGLASSIECYALQKGDYCITCTDGAARGSILRDMRLVGLGIFVDAAGRSAMADQRSCLTQLAVPAQPDGKLGVYLSKQGLYFSGAFNIVKTEWKITVPRAAVDLATASHFVMLPGLLGGDAIVRYEVLMASNRVAEAQQLLQEKATLSLVPGEHRDSCAGLKDIAQALMLNR